jgi:hypothetical protein
LLFVHGFTYMRAHISYLMAQKGWSAVRGPRLTLKPYDRSLKKTQAERIAKSLKRSEGATRQKAFSLGLSLDFRWHSLSASFKRNVRPARGECWPSILSQRPDAQIRRRLRAIFDH